jgi:hypothetical protein
MGGSCVVESITILLTLSLLLLLPRCCGHHDLLTKQLEILCSSAGKNRPLDAEELAFMDKLTEEEASREKQKRLMEEEGLEEFRKVNIELKAEMATDLCFLNGVDKII